MFRILLTIVTLIAVSGAGFGAYRYVTYVKQKEFTAANSTPVFVTLSPIFVPIVRDGELIETRIIQMSVETREGGPYMTALKERARLHDMMLRYLSALAERRGPENIDDIEYVRSQLITASAELLGPGVVRNVAFESIITRPPG